MADKLRPTPPKMREYDKDVILRWLAYHIQPEMRRAIMAEHPEAYNRWVAQTVAVVTVFDDND